MERHVKVGYIVISDLVEENPETETLNFVMKWQKPSTKLSSLQARWFLENTKDRECQCHLAEENV